MNSNSPIVFDSHHSLPRLAGLLGHQPRWKLSIDQNFLWNFAEEKHPDAMRLREVIRTGVKAKKLICPLHQNETVFESALLPGELRAAIFAIAQEFSGGLAFHPFAASAQIETLMLMRRNTVVPGLRRGSLSFLPNTDVTALGAENRTAKKEYQERLDQHPYPPKSFDPKMSRDEVHAGIVLERAGSMFRVVTAIRDKGTVETGKPEWEISIAIGQFLLDAQLNIAECDELLRSIQHHEWERTPALFAHSGLCAQLEWDYLKGGRKGRSNDYLDLSRLAVALNDADVVLCDHSMASLIRQSPLAKEVSLPQTFSFRELGKAIDCLESRL